MYISLRLLNSFVDVEEFFQKPQELASCLTLSGTEVESFEDLSKKYESLLIGEVVQKKPHPRADRLNLCLVRTTVPSVPSPPLSIVCGADNFQAGDLVVVAPVGAKLQGGVPIKARKIRGETSQGMILSLSELGLPPPAGAEESGILVLPLLPGVLPPKGGGGLFRRHSLSPNKSHPQKETAPLTQEASSEEPGFPARDFVPSMQESSVKERGFSARDFVPRVGQSFAQFVGWDDIIFKLVITPNRGDLLSHFGLARELSALLNKKLKSPQGGGLLSPWLFVPTETSHKEKRFSAKGKALLRRTLPSFLRQKLQTKKGVFLQGARSLSGKKPHPKNQVFRQGVLPPLSVHIACPDQCYRYTGRAVYGVKLAPSPLHLRCRLQALGVKSINNVVDITNYTMLVWGGPLHAFDRDRIGGSSLSIDQARKGETLKTLEGTTLSFHGGSW